MRVICGILQNASRRCMIVELVRKAPSLVAQVRAQQPAAWLLSVTCLGRQTATCGLCWLWADSFEHPCAYATVKTSASNFMPCRPFSACCMDIQQNRGRAMAAD